MKIKITAQSIKKPSQLKKKKVLKKLKNMKKNQRIFKMISKALQVDYLS